ncbi:major tail protein [Gordonibacter sp. Marseille-P4307]|uniref:major tail protein n=1 Tax=Gordonibacter sp. Marseille-P4307 TaxID=2161815 RepID=UPI000F51C6BA|nr:major tail protein [Gordonibacter sp. Marseille-P4307]
MAANQNKVQYGLSNVHVAFAKGDGYDAPIHVPGAVQLTADPEGGEKVFYADNTTYYVVNKKDGYKGSLELALFPEAVRARMLGDYIDASGHYVEDANGKPEHFALLAQVEGDVSERGICYFDVVAARPKSENKTAEGDVEVQTESADISMLNKRFADTGVTTPKMVVHKEDADWTTFFTKVPAPKAKTASES